MVLIKTAIPKEYNRFPENRFLIVRNGRPERHVRRSGITLFSETIPHNY